MIKALRKVRFDAKPGKKKGTLDVLVPCYRGDMMHPVDMTEEVAIGYGYNNLPTTLSQAESANITRRSLHKDWFAES